MDIIAIHTTCSRKTRVHIISNPSNVTDGDIPRQQTIQFVGQLNAVQFMVYIEMSYHHTSMYSCISTSSTCHGNIIT